MWLRGNGFLEAEQGNDMVCLSDIGSIFDEKWSGEIVFRVHERL